MEAPGLAFATFVQRPDLLGAVFGPELQSAAPEFMRHDPVAALYYGDGRLDCYREFGLVAVDPAQPDRPVARAFSVPFAFRDGTRGREELPDGGWDAVIHWADEDRRAGRPATAISALEIMVVPRLQRRGSSRLMLTALRDNARRLGFVDLYAPLRPTDKHREPLTPFADYVARRREDGLPYDSWVRTHVQAGAQIVKVAPRSMIIAGTIAEWSRWTGLDFTASGRAIVPGALSPIHVSLEQDHAVYVEPNYVARRREDGLPYDSWVRTHVRAGAQIVKVAPRSMVIAGTIAEWSRWTGLGFTASGPAIVPGALSPIHVSLEQDHAVYVEPNLWVHHRLI